MLTWLALVPALFAVLAWLSAAVHAFLLLQHVAPPHTAISLLFQGFRFFQADTFRPSGHPIQRRFLVSVAVFGLSIALAVALGALAAGLAR